MIEAYLRVLTDEHRRQLLLTLLERDEPQDIPVPETIAQGEDDLTALRVEFHQLHLPKLEHFGLIEWNQKADTIRKGPHFERIRPLLEGVEKVDQSLDEHR